MESKIATTIPAFTIMPKIVIVNVTVNDVVRSLIPGYALGFAISFLADDACPWCRR
jgi:hypothetical protein